MIQVVSVNVGRSRPLSIDGRTVYSAFDKRAVDGAVAVRPLGLEGDEQADPSLHGGLSKAVYAYPHEHYAFWQVVRAQARVAAWDAVLPPGALGENLSLRGLLEGDLWIGDYLRLPGCVLAVSAPRRPCYKLDHMLGFAHATRLMQQSGYCGAYLAVIEPGQVRAGDAAELLPGPREVNLRELFIAQRHAR